MPDGAVMLVDGADLLERSAYYYDEEPEHSSEHFKLERYDWSDLLWQRSNVGHFAYRVVPLTKGYFAMVSPDAYALVTEHEDGARKHWRANVQYGPRGELSRVYAIRNGRKRLGEPAVVYMHREIVGVWDSHVIVDHVNGYTLDNRSWRDQPVNLRTAGVSENASNYERVRTVNFGLPRGVQPTRYGKFRASRFVRTRERQQSISKVFDTAEEAGRWYQEQLTTAHGRRDWAHNPVETSAPVFPPRLDEEMAEASWLLRDTARESILEEIPF